MHVCLATGGWQGAGGLDAVAFWPIFFVECSTWNSRASPAALVLLFHLLVHIQELERLELKAELYEKLGGPEDLERAEELVQGLVRRSPDQWSYYVTLLDLLDKRNGGCKKKKSLFIFVFFFSLVVVWVYWARWHNFIILRLKCEC